MCPPPASIIMDWGAVLFIAVRFPFFYTGSFCKRVRGSENQMADLGGDDFVAKALYFL